MKIVLIVIVGIVMLFFMAAFFMKREFSIVREITIDRPRNEVFDYIKLLKNQDYFSKWVMADPNMKKTFRGIDGTLGFVYAWDGNDKAGKGEQEIIKIVEGESLEVEVRFEKPFKGLSKAPFILRSVAPNRTIFQWGLNGTRSYPMNIMNPMLDGMLGKDIESSLLTLKTILENNE